MAYAKLKKEEYKNIGGINQKASVYVTGEREVLDLINYDFQIAGAMSQRPGMTAALLGNTLAVGASNRLNFGFQTYRMFYQGFGVIANASFSQVSYLQSNSLTYSVSLTTGVLGTPLGGTLTPTAGFGNAVNMVADVSFPTSMTADTAYENQAYFASGRGTFKALTSGIYYYGLPPYVDGLGQGFAYGFTGGGYLTGTYNFILAYGDGSGYVGAAGLTWPIIPTNEAAIQMSGFSMTTKALQSGATYVYIFSDRVLGFAASDFALVGLWPTLPPSATLSIFADSTNTLLPYHYPLQDSFVYTPVVPNIAFPAGGFDFNAGEADVVESYANRVFWGVSKGKNLLYFSQPVEFIADAQSIEVDSFLQVRNQNYPLTALKSYNQSLIVLFQKGVNRLTGDNPNNFNAQNLTDKYGAVCQRAVVVWKERMWFLDEYQIIEFNGSNFTDVSNRVDGYLQRMNVTAAQKTACAYHYEDRNEVWFAIPIDGSTENNLILVYDYAADGWYVTKSSSNFTMLQNFTTQVQAAGASSSTVFLNDPKLYSAHPGGSMGYFGNGFKTDYGQGFTLSFKSRYHVEQGPSTTMEWRRLYLDTGPWAGVTLSFNTNFYANFATATISLTRTIYASGSPYSGPQQTRIDFGIPAKSLSIQTSFVTGETLPFVRIYGYTVESRFLRNV